MEKTTTEPQKLNKLDSLSNLGTDNVTLDEEPEEATMKVDPLKAISKEEYDALVMHNDLVQKIYTEGNKEKDDKINPMSSIAADAEKELYIKMAEKFGLKNIDLLRNTDVRFRLRQGYFIEAYNA